MDKTGPAPRSASPHSAPEAIAADKLAIEYHWPAGLGTFDGWARFADYGLPPEPPTAHRAPTDE